MEHNKSTKRVFIYIRKKPLLTNDEDICYVNSIHNLSIKIDKVKVNLEKEIQFKHFYADCVFDENKSNEEIFQQIVNNRLNRENKNLIYFAYGQSGTGKTHTLLGIEGLIYKTCKKLLSQYNITFSSFQLYEDNIYDLYNNHKARIFDRNNSIFVSGITENIISNENKLLSILDVNKRNRHQGISSHNNTSSRSHAVYRIRYTVNNHSYSVQFIDLAGTERACNANINMINKNSYINTSLLSLKECIRAYINNNKYIPFRSNKLTLYLRDFFINNCCIMMMSMISPEKKHLVDTLDTLKYTEYMNQISKYKNFKINYIPKNLVKDTVVLKPENYDKDLIKIETKYVRNIPILSKIENNNITRKNENKVLRKRKKKIKEINKNDHLLLNYIQERDKIIENEDDLILGKKDKNFQNSIIDILNQKINCIEKFCFGMKNKYEI